MQQKRFLFFILCILSLKKMHKMKNIKIKNYFLVPMYTRKGRNFHRLEIGLASPLQIQNWAERYLPTGEKVGEVTSWETVNYKTLKPEPNGLFCQRIFGPVIDYTCACGKKSTKVEIGFCSKCGVERTTSRVRRYRLGFIKLKQPVVHTLYATHKPSPLSLCLDWSNKRVQAVMYATEFCHLSPDLKRFASYFEFSQIFFSNRFRGFVTQSSKTKNENLTKEFEDYTRKNFSPRSIIFQKVQSTTKSKLFKFLENTHSTKNSFFAATKFSFFKNRYPASKLNLSLHSYAIAYDMTWRQVEDLQEFLLYCWEHSDYSDGFIPFYNFTSTIQNKLTKQIPKHDQYYPIQTGGFVYQKIFSSYDLINFQRQLQLQHQELKNLIVYLQEKSEINSLLEKEKTSILKKLNRLKQSEKKCLRRLNYFRDFQLTNTQPAWMILSYLPVLPPGLRPITSIRGELIVSDINSLYRKVLTRNKRLNNGSSFDLFDTALSGSWASWCYNLRQVQESVDNLLKTGSLESGKTTKSLLDALKGKRGRFRQHLLGKRVDYSGRSVIVVGPALKIHECGIPKQIALELFQPFIIQRLRNKGIVFTTTAAKAIIAERKPIVWALLVEILKNHPVLLNRAPTLHRLGIQAFLPKLVEGKAILLHPLVCPAFNADFDGDQMAVHVPLSPSARAEAFKLLWARNHILAPASGQPLLLPSQDMVLGFYYLTISKEIQIATISKKISNDGPQTEFTETKEQEFYFSNFLKVKESLDRNIIKIHTPIWMKWVGNVQNHLNEQQAKIKDTPLEIRLQFFGNCEFIFVDRVESQNSKMLKQSFYIRTTAGRVFMHEYIFKINSKKI